MDLKRLNSVGSKKVVDSLSKQKSIVFHSTSSDDLYEILITRKFKAGRGGGAMLGPGFYANQHLYQAQKHNYGRLILMARVENVDKFFFCDYLMYNEFFGKDLKSYDELWDVQISDKNSYIYKSLKSLFAGRTGRVPQSGRIAYYWKEIYDLGYQGLVYYGDYDKESIVCWQVKNVIPLGVSFDDGKSWKDPKAAIKQKVEATKDISGSENIHSGNEYQKSLQRAYDLKKRLEGKPDDVILRHINNQLSRITEPMKKVVRKEAFQEVFPNLNIE